MNLTLKQLREALDRITAHPLTETNVSAVNLVGAKIELAGPRFEDAMTIHQLRAEIAELKRMIG